MVGSTLVRMVTISCSCGSVCDSRRNPLRGLDVAERLRLVEEAFAVHDGFLTLEVDAAWHPGSDDPGPSCVVLVDLDEVDACVGLAADDAAAVRAALRGTRVGGRPLPAPVLVDGTWFRVAPAQGFVPHVTYVVHDGAGTVLEVDEPLVERDLVAELVDTFARAGRDGLVHLDAVAARRSLAGALDAARHAPAVAVA
ncbi:hypothetical protein CBZ_34930 [Cellulomonas biazotea]|uniref:Uncharacterized protein n=2 Tax=Cellulomonas biazotea TaxID=1709 RepID=A0A402DWE1_9CELL|nr:hypothetical protein CBZ_34930 [Cellulomonas biazotea]